MEEINKTFEMFKEKTNVRLSHVEDALSELKGKLVEMDKLVRVD